MPTLLEIDRLEVEYRQRRRAPAARAVDNVTFAVDTGTTVGLVGESGSGKSSIGRAVLGLARPSAGRITFAGRDITVRRGDDDRRLAADIQVVFQDPYSSLDPIRTVADSVSEPIRATGTHGRADMRRRVQELLRRVRLPADAADRYPGQFSGGQRQRIGIARALALEPRLVICDEAVSALDLSTQAQVINLLADVQQETGVSYLFIAHDLAIVRSVCRYVVVLYHGRVMEQGPAEDVYREPKHPYTRTLLAAAPIAEPTRQAERRRARQEMREAAARAALAHDPRTDRTDRCPFVARCPHVADVCVSRRPAKRRVGPVELECHLYDPTSGHPQA
jgi:peptide/nickel transport system ATP-binding protein